MSCAAVNAAEVYPVLTSNRVTDRLRDSSEMKDHGQQLSLLEIGESPTGASGGEPRGPKRQKTSAHDTRRKPRAAGEERASGAPPDGSLLTIEDVATRLRVHRRTVQRLVARGELAAVHIGSAVRFDPRDLAGLIAGQRRREATASGLPPSRPRAARGVRVSFAERLRSERHEHREAHA
jgi:excisionase family DNA binding protein